MASISATDSTPSEFIMIASGFASRTCAAMAAQSGVPGGGGYEMSARTSNPRSSAMVTELGSPSSSGEPWVT